jgi:hypothetical protein
VNEPVRAWWADAVVWDNHACMPLRADDSFRRELPFRPPEQIPPLIALLFDRGYPRDAILKIIGGNHLRVATAAWH